MPKPKSTRRRTTKRRVSKLSVLEQTQHEIIAALNSIQEKLQSLIPAPPVRIEDDPLLCCGGSLATIQPADALRIQAEARKSIEQKHGVKLPLIKGSTSLSPRAVKIISKVFGGFANASPSEVLIPPRPKGKLGVDYEYDDYGRVRTLKRKPTAKRVSAIELVEFERLSRPKRKKKNGKPKSK